MDYNMITNDNVETKDMMFISINNPCERRALMGKNDVYSYFKRQHSNVMIMHFPDYGENTVEKYIEMGIASCNMFNEYKAKKLYEFIKKNKDKSMVVLHCGAGISRSYSIGLFIYDFFNDKKDNIIKHSPRCSLNYHIFRLLKEQYYTDHHISYPKS